MAEDIPIKLKFVADVADALKGFGTISALAAIGLGAASRVAIDFDSALNAVSRSANIDYGSAALKEFGSEIKKVAPTLGMMPVEFAKLASESAKLGIAKEGLLDFTTVVGQVAQIGDLTGEAVVDLGRSFAALQTITGTNTAETKAYAAAVNRLDDEIGGSMPDIIEFTRQTAATGKLLGINTQSLAAYGSTMASLGIKNGVAYNSMNALMEKLAAPQTLSATAVEGLEALGYSVEEMSGIMARDANGGIRQFLGRIQELGATDKQKALGAVKQLVGNDFGNEILTLAASTGKLDQALKAAGDSTGNLNKYQDELKKKANSFAGQSAIMKANLQSIGISIGTAVLPALNSLMGAITPLVLKFAEFADSHPKIMLVGVSLLAVVAAIAPVGMAISSVVGAWTGLTAAWAVAVPFVSGTLIPALAGIGGTLVGLLPVIAAVAAAIGVWSFVIKEYKANWDDVVLGISYTLGQVKGIVSEFGYAVQGSLMSLRESVVSVLGDFGGIAFEAGSALVRSIADGIWAASGAGLVTSAISATMDAARQYLPFSPAKKGALSDLDKSGGALINTLVAGVDANSSRLNSALNSALNLSLGGKAQAPLAMATAGGGGNITVNFSVNLGAGNGGGGGNQSIIEQLRPYAAQIGEEIERALAKSRRGG